jgi:hypothetical protein
VRRCVLQDSAHLTAAVPGVLACVRDVRGLEANCLEQQAAETFKQWYSLSIPSVSWSQPDHTLFTRAIRCCLLL